jgi:hypothetical protein
MTKQLLTISVIFMALLEYSCSSDNQFILNQTFDKNDIGWVEESTDFHDLEIKGGKYHIHCKDTATLQSSTGPLDVSFLTGLPKKYEISSSINFIDGQKENEIGIILVSASLKYRFSIYKDGQIKVLSYDYNEEKETVLCSEKYGDSVYDKDNTVKLKISVDGKSFKYNINEKLICEGELKTLQWFDLRLFASSTSQVEFDNLIIERLN